MIHSINNFLIRQSKLSLIVLSIIFVLVLGMIDHISGAELSFAVFYIAPILMSTWYHGRNLGIFISVFAALTWLTADLSSGHEYSHSIIPLWNCLVRFGFFIVISLMVNIIRIRLEMEEALADTDYLTGLKNSRSFYEHVEAESLRSRRYRRPFTLAYIDLDNFKYINDAMGHDAGNDVLQKVAKTIRENVRQSDVISRLGGDEFAALFPETGSKAAGAIIRNLMPLLSEAMQSSKWPITFSVGAVSFPKPLNTVREMIKTVDDLMYEVKKSGKNNVIHREWNNGAL